MRPRGRGGAGSDRAGTAAGDVAVDEVRGERMSGSSRCRRGHRIAAQDVASVDATGGRRRKDSGRVADVAVCEARGEGGVERDTPPQMRDTVCGQGHRTIAVVPAWTWRYGMAAWDVAMDMSVPTTAGNVTAASAMAGGRGVEGRAAADEVTGQPRWMSPPWT